MTTSQTNTIRLRSRDLAELADRSRNVLDLRDPAESPNRAGDESSVSYGRHERVLLHPSEAVRPYLSTRFAVRAFDIAVAIVGLVALTPFMIAVAIAVRLDSSGPVFYGSPRLGHNRPVFKAWKFRSMYPDADEQLKRLLRNDPRAAEEYQVFHKLKDDPRLTRVGSFIRRTSLDELPQLFNILVGDMSVVGPRPKLLHEGQLFGEALPVVLQVRPGLTGLWQVSGRNRLPVHDRILLDIDYARNRTMLGDIAICFRTFLQLWRPGKHGAY